MTRIRDRLSGGQWLPAAAYGLFFAALFVYLWRVVEPHLIYDAFGTYLRYPAFSPGGRFLAESLGQVGGPVTYASAYLSQWFFYSPVGALILTFLAILICLALRCLTGQLSGARWWVLSLLPAPVLLVPYQRYYHPLPLLLALALCLWFTVAYASIRPQRLGLRIGLVVLLCAGLYYVAGNACVLFGSLVALWEGAVHRRRILPVAALAAGVLMPWLVGVHLFYLTREEAFGVHWPYGPAGAPDMDAVSATALRVLYLYPLAVVLLLGLRLALARGKTTDKPAKPRGLAVRTALQAGVLGAAALASILTVPDADRRRSFELVHFARRRAWEDVLAAARQVSARRYDAFCNHLVNRALYHTGRFADEMFSFPQNRAGLMLFTADVPHSPLKAWMLPDTAMDLGHINLAEQWAYETFEGQGDCPWVLEKLALIYKAKGQHEAARIFLRRMQKDPVHGRRATELLAYVEKGSAEPHDWATRAQTLAEQACEKDWVYQVCSEQSLLENMLEDDPTNRMAFEYLMAYFLLTKQTHRLAEFLPRLGELGYARIPRHFQEALAVHSATTRERVPVRRETIERFNAFSRQLAPLRDRKEAAMRQLAPQFGDSYFYYHVFGISGVQSIR